MTIPNYGLYGDGFLKIYHRGLTSPSSSGLLQMHTSPSGHAIYGSGYVAPANINIPVSGLVASGIFCMGSGNFAQSSGNIPVFQTLHGQFGSGESFGYSFDTDGRWLVVGCPTWDFVIPGGKGWAPYEVSKNCGRVKVFKKQSNGEYKQFGAPIHGSDVIIGLEEGDQPFFGYDVKITNCEVESPTSITLSPSGQSANLIEKATNDRYPVIAVSAPFASKTISTPEGTRKLDFTGSVFLIHPVYMDELKKEEVQKKSFAQPIETSTSKTYNPDGSVSSKQTSAGRDYTYINPNVAGGTTPPHPRDIKSGKGQSFSTGGADNVNTD